MNNISLIQLARMAGVSKTTASLIINNKADQHKISKKTKERVLALAQEYGYKPNRLALNLSTGQSHLIGVILPDVKQGDYASLLEAIERELGQRGYRLLVGFHKEQASVEAALINDFLEQQVDGLLLVSNGKNPKQLLVAKNKGVAIVLLERPVEELEMSLVMYDFNEAIAKLIRHWYVRNRRAIAYVGQQGICGWGREAYRKHYCERFSMKRQYERYVPVENSANAIGEIVKELIDQGINAILFESPALLIESYRTLQAIKRMDLGNMVWGVIGWHQSIDFLPVPVSYIPTQPVKLVASVVASWESYKDHTPKQSKLLKVALNEIILGK